MKNLIHALSPQNASQEELLHHVSIWGEARVISQTEAESYYSTPAIEDADKLD